MDTFLPRSTHISIKCRCNISIDDAVSASAASLARDAKTIAYKI